MKIFLAFILFCFIVGVATRNSRSRLAAWMPFIGAVALSIGYYVFNRT
jgi:hypothetical protein